MPGTEVGVKIYGKKAELQRYNVTTWAFVIDVSLQNSKLMINDCNRSMLSFIFMMKVNYIYIHRIRHLLIVTYTVQI